MYKKEWNREDFAKVDRKIRQYFGGKWFKNHLGLPEYCPKKMYDLEMVLGLPYTSSGIFACYSLSCNTNLFLDSVWYFDYAVIRESDNKVCLLLSDKDENEKVIVI